MQKRTGTSLGIIFRSLAIELPGMHAMGGGGFPPNKTKVRKINEKRGKGDREKERGGGVEGGIIFFGAVMQVISNPRKTT